MLLLLPVPVQAAGQSLIAEETQRLLDQLELAPLQQMTPEIDLARIADEAAQGISPFDPQVILQKLKDLTARELTGVLPVLMRVAGIGILCAGVTQLGIRQEAGSLCEIAGTLCTGLMVSAPVAELFSVAEAAMQRIADFTDALLPTLLALLTAMGGTQSAAGLKRLTLAASGGIAQLGQGVLLTLLGCSAALVLITAVSDGDLLKGTCKTLRSTVHWLLGACFAVFLGCIAVQGGVGAHYDSVALRVARYAADKTIPVVGGMFKDASDTLIGCALIVKNALGTAGLAALLTLLAQPLVRILCTLLGFRLCAAALDLFGGGRISKMLNGFADILLTLFILILSAGAMSLIMVSALMHTGMGFI